MPLMSLNFSLFLNFPVPQCSAKICVKLKGTRKKLQGVQFYFIYLFNLFFATPRNIIMLLRNMDFFFFFHLSWLILNCGHSSFFPSTLFYFQCKDSTVKAFAQLSPLLEFILCNILNYT